MFRWSLGFSSSAGESQVWNAAWEIHQTGAEDFWLIGSAANKGSSDASSDHRLFVLTLCAIRFITAFERIRFDSLVYIN